MKARKNIHIFHDICNLTRTIALAGAVAIGSGFVSPSQAIVFTFDMGLGDGGVVNQSYGDNVTSLTDGSFIYGADGGFTPNVTVDYGSDIFGWVNDYGDLTNILWSGENNGILAITLNAEPNYEVVLDSFDLAGWPNTDYTINSVTVTDGSNTLFSQSNVAIEGDSGHTDFDFASPLTASQLVISFDSTNLGGNRDNIGIDNIQFSQQAVDVPFELSPNLGLLLLGSLFSCNYLYRKHKERMGRSFN